MANESDESFVGHWAALRPFLRKRLVVLGWKVGKVEPILEIASGSRLMILGYPFSAKKLWVKNDLVWLGFSIDISAKKCGISDGKRRFALEKLRARLRLKNPTLNQAQSAGGSSQWISQMCPWLRPFLAGLYAFFKNKGHFGKLAGNYRLRTSNMGIILGNTEFPRPPDLCLGIGWK